MFFTFKCFARIAQLLTLKINTIRPIVGNKVLSRTVYMGNTDALFCDISLLQLSAIDHVYIGRTLPRQNETDVDIEDSVSLLITLQTLNTGR